MKNKKELENRVDCLTRIYALNQLARFVDSQPKMTFCSREQRTPRY